MDINNKDEHHKRGYLHKNFALFHLKDKKDMQFEFHYHEFSKIIIFISGNTTYLIEGKAYKLKPWDILLINNNEIHKPIIDAGKIYERIILWVDSSFVTKHNYEGCNLLTSFEKVSEQKFNLLRLPPELLSGIQTIIFQLEDACKNQDFGSEILKHSLFLQFIVYLNRTFLGYNNIKEHVDVAYDETIVRILKFINENISENLSIDNLASSFYLNKYYLMHKFKQQTGYTIHNYILQKRLIAANALIKEGKSITTACIESGFGDYSNFIKVFKKKFGLSPKKYYKQSAPT